MGCEGQALGQRRNCHTDAAWRNAADVGAAKLHRELTAGVTCSGVTLESDTGPQVTYSSRVVLMMKSINRRKELS